ncbi:hypothetical protein E1264_03780 [Actinomadura sp. KC216]|uniref:hypothetical protein n=1 Tax=Actinomadura sp. KC216 TaxID=2530370 RepID=UPI00104C710B|nr:hypothetical protein [Actinomadura sp. KC216]TDB90935.1 hypothetical protein E1264_03780 [Actinomadura sp. KC216]
MNEEIQIIQPILGLKPFILLEFSAEEGSEDIAIGVQFGGGIVGEEVPQILDMVRESIEEQFA